MYPQGLRLPLSLVFILILSSQSSGAYTKVCNSIWASACAFVHLCICASAHLWICALVHSRMAKCRGSSRDSRNEFLSAHCGTAVGCVASCIPDHCLIFPLAHLLIYYASAILRRQRGTKSSPVSWPRLFALMPTHLTWPIWPGSRVLGSWNLALGTQLGVVWLSAASC